MKTSRAMVLEGPGRMVLKEFPLPGIGPEEGLLRVDMVGVCGSDVGMFRGKVSRVPRPYPIIMGHEIFGTVVEVGREASRRHGVMAGDRAIVEYAFGCGECFYCTKGDYIHCESFQVYGSMISCKEPPHLFGAYGEFLYIHPNAKVHRIGEEISPQLVVLICAVLGNGIRWLRQMGNVSVGDAVAIIGPGQQGLAGVAVAKESGAGPIFVIGLEKDRRRLDMAARFGADRTIVVNREDPFEVIHRETGGKMADVVMDVSGHPSGAELGLPLVGRRGTFVLPGLYKHQKASLDLDLVVTKEIRVQRTDEEEDRWRRVRDMFTRAEKG